jgi:F-type H+-transporting ATPase subunit delta|tara:strand:+ start:398 stop:928 length:531 start_codon:yes stop_codon:yes gene_type:complete
MKQSRAAIRYAKAVFSLAKDKEISIDVYNDMFFYVELSKNDKTFSQMLINSVIDLNSKRNIILSLNSQTCDLSKDLIGLLILNKRLPILIDVANSYKTLYEKSNNMTKAIVITALPITEDIRVKALQKINSISNKKIEIINTIDREILGGFILRYEGKEYNASLSSKLQKIKKELI